MINETKNWFFEKKFLNDKNLARFTKIEKAKKRDGGTQVKPEKKRCCNWYLKNKKDHKKKYYEKLYSNKLDNLKEIDTFIETYNIPKLNHDKIENLNRLITSRENESVIKNLPTNKCSGRTRWLHW